jgi:hypothetical protein
MATNYIIEKVNGTDSSSNRIASTFYGTCGTAAATAQKEVTLSDSCVFNDSCLVTGVTIHVKFSYINSNATPTLKVGTATAKQIMAYGTTKAGTTATASWYAGAVVSFTYDGTYWVMNDYKKDNVPLVEGTGTVAGTWLGTLDGLTGYYDGLMILYKINIKGASTTTLNLNSLGAKTCYIYGTIKLATQYPVNSIILLVYSANQNGGCWMCASNYYYTYFTMTASELVDGTATIAKTVRADYLKQGIEEIIGENSVELTQAEYDALPDSKLTDGVNYFITDTSTVMSATDVSYKNVGSGVSASNVQGAIDELDSTIDELSAMSTQTAGAITANSTYISAVERNGWYKVGRVVMFWMTATVKTTWTSTCIFGSGLPAPVHNFRFIGQIATGNSNYPLRLEIADNGNIHNAYSITNPQANQTIEFSGCYISAK